MFTNPNITKSGESFKSAVRPGTGTGAVRRVSHIVPVGDSLTGVSVKEV